LEIISKMRVKYFIRMIQKNNHLRKTKRGMRWSTASLLIMSY
jgi:hypothetical protein